MTQQQQQQQQQYHEEKVVPPLLEALSEALQSNRAAIRCLQANDTKRALELFSISFSKHERAKSKIFAAMRNRNARNSSSNIGINIIIDRGMGDWLVREKSLVTPCGNVGGRNLVYYEPIRFPLAIKAVASSTSAILNDNGIDPGQSDESVSNALDLLTTSHAYNLGLVNHIYGLKVLYSTNKDEASVRTDFSASNSHRNSTTATAHTTANTTGALDDASAASRAKIHFDRAGRMYALVLRMERSRSKDDPHHRNNVHRLIVVLGCLNNLADLYHKSHQGVRSKHCYMQLKTTSEQMLGLLLRGQPSPHHQREERLLRSYLPSFWTRARKGLSRWRRRSNSSGEIMSENEDPVEQNTSARSTRTSPWASQSKYVFNSPSAGAA